MARERFFVLPVMFLPLWAGLSRFLFFFGGRKRESLTTKNYRVLSPSGSRMPVEHQKDPCFYHPLVGGCLMGAMLAYKGGRGESQS
jgi:hypothetical protein